MMHDNGGGGLLGVELVFFRERDADVVGAQQCQELALVGEVGAGGVAKGVAAAAIALLQDRFGVAGLVGGEAQFAADALVDVFGEGLGHLDRKAVQVKVVLVAVVGEPFARR